MALPDLLDQIHYEPFLQGVIIFLDVLAYPDGLYVCMKTLGYCICPDLLLAQSLFFLCTFHLNGSHQDLGEKPRHKGHPGLFATQSVFCGYYKCPQTILGTQTQTMRGNYLHNAPAP